MYIDPNAPEPDNQPTRPSLAPGGLAGSAVGDILAAAESGRLRVDPATGAATIRAITAVQEQVDTLRGLASGGTRLGGGYAVQIDRFNREWTVAGAGSAAEVMGQFSAELGRLRDAVTASMAAYQDSEDGATRRVAQAATTLEPGTTLGQGR